MAYTDMEQHILEMWPKFEDGSYVWFGDAYSDAECRDKEVEVIEFDGRRVYIAGHKGLCTMLIPGERVKRPAVIAADGEPLEVGQMVYVIENGKTHHVTEVDAVSKRFRSMEQVDGSHWLDPTCFTHKRPVLDADGVEIKVGDIAYSIRTGAKCKVEGIEGDGVIKTDDEYGSVEDIRKRLMPEGMEWLLDVWPKWSNGDYCKFGDLWVAPEYGHDEPEPFRNLAIYTPEQLKEWGQDKGDCFGYQWDFMRPSDPSYRPKKVKPEPPDSWEQLEDDMGDDMAQQQCGPVSPEIAAAHAAEFVRRAKALAEKEAGR